MVAISGFRVNRGPGVWVTLNACHLGAFLILSAIQVSKRQKLLINYKNVFLYSAAVFGIFLCFTLFSWPSNLI